MIKFDLNEENLSLSIRPALFLAIIDSLEGTEGSVHGHKNGWTLCVTNYNFLILKKKKRIRTSFVSAGQSPATPLRSSFSSIFLPDAVHFLYVNKIRRWAECAQLIQLARAKATVIQLISASVCLDDVAGTNLTLYCN